MYIVFLINCHDEDTIGIMSADDIVLIRSLWSFHATQILLLSPAEKFAVFFSII